MRSRRAVRARPRVRERHAIYGPVVVDASIAVQRFANELCLRAPAGIRRAEVGPGGQGEGAHAVGEAVMLLLLLAFDAVEQTKVLCFFEPGERESAKVS